MDRETESVLILVGRALRFATDHPYAATFMLGGAIGSAITYQVMLEEQRYRVSKLFTPKVYNVALQIEDLQHLLHDPTAELRWETPEISVVIMTERREDLKALPVVDVEGEDIEYEEGK